MTSKPSSILMIRPVGFGYNPQTAITNAFQNKTEGDDTSTIQRLALAEFEGMTNLLKNNGINVIIFDDTHSPPTPDSIFPNNWISFHDETLILYPMLAENRRQEKRADIVEHVKKHFNANKNIDLSGNVTENIFLEGTGSLVFDYQNRYAFACLSPRTDKLLAEHLCKQTGFTPVLFNSTDKNGQAIYHTNVMMCMGEKFCVICLDTISNKQQKEFVRNSITKTGHELIEITQEQVEKFAGNMYELINNKGEHLLLMSEQAYGSLREDQVKKIEKYCRPLTVPLYTIEKHGGGSVRCMIADIRLKSKE